MAGDEAGEGLLVLDGEFAGATMKLMARALTYQARARSRAELYQAAIQRVDAVGARELCKPGTELADRA